VLKILNSFERERKQEGRQKHMDAKEYEEVGSCA